MPHGGFPRLGPWGYLGKFGSKLEFQYGRLGAGFLFEALDVVSKCMSPSTVVSSGLVGIDSKLSETCSSSRNRFTFLFLVPDVVSSEPIKDFREFILLDDSLLCCD